MLSSCCTDSDVDCVNYEWILFFFFSIAEFRKPFGCISLLPVYHFDRESITCRLYCRMRSVGAHKMNENKKSIKKPRSTELRINVQTLAVGWSKNKKEKKIKRKEFQREQSAKKTNRRMKKLGHDDGTESIENSYIQWLGVALNWDDRRFWSFEKRINRDQVNAKRIHFRNAFLSLLVRFDVAVMKQKRN